ncbi:hypothetical protein BSL78_22681 [Apostichopus japonicus]|uniref:Uncharacterized protein n=1 Tax=Stichopus japonicus TaxID=307972 RepID=A0A2G8JXM4_STIJA|nr:hypothetical protein BSL78_22681 [Apostichopus japonicus]
MVPSQGTEVVLKQDREVETNNLPFHPATTTLNSSRQGYPIPMASRDDPPVHDGGIPGQEITTSVGPRLPQLSLPVSRYRTSSRWQRGKHQLRSSPVTYLTLYTPRQPLVARRCEVRLVLGPTPRASHHRAVPLGAKVVRRQVSEERSKYSKTYWFGYLRVTSLPVSIPASLPRGGGTQPDGGAVVRLGSRLQAQHQIDRANNY